MTHVALHVSDVMACAAFYQQYCALEIVHERRSSDTGEPIYWMAEAGRERQLIIVLLPGGRRRNQPTNDYSHLGFALGSREQVDGVAERARQAGRLIWEPREEPYPVGYYCGVRDPNGMTVEFSYGQPLGPGADAASPA